MNFSQVYVSNTTLSMFHIFKKKKLVWGPSVHLSFHNRRKINNVHPHIRISFGPPIQTYESVRPFTHFYHHRKKLVRPSKQQNFVWSVHSCIEISLGLSVHSTKFHRAWKILGILHQNHRSMPLLWYESCCW